MVGHAGRSNARRRLGFEGRLWCLFGGSGVHVGRRDLPPFDGFVRVAVVLDVLDEPANDLRRGNVRLSEGWERRWAHQFLVLDLFDHRLFAAFASREEGLPAFGAFVEIPVLFVGATRADDRERHFGFFANIMDLRFVGSMREVGCRRRECKLTSASLFTKLPRAEVW